MNFGQNLYNWFLSNAQSLVLMAIVVIGVYLGFKREFSKLIGFLVIALIAVGLVFNAAGVKDVLYLDSRTKAAQILQFKLTLGKDRNWKIVKQSAVAFTVVNVYNDFNVKERWLK